MKSYPDDNLQVKVILACVHSTVSALCGVRLYYETLPDVTPHLVYNNLYLYCVVHLRGCYVYIELYQSYVELVLYYETLWVFVFVLYYIVHL